MWGWRDYDAVVTMGTGRKSRKGRGRPPHPDVLTPVEWAVLLQVRAGRSNPEIAQMRRCRVDTVKYHVANIIGKLELTDREALARWAGRPLPDEPGPGIDLRAWERRTSMPTTTRARTTLTDIAPMFLVDDVAKTAEWYRDTLGFEIGEYFREDHEGEHEHDEHGNHVGEFEHDQSLGEPVFVIISRDGRRLMLGKTVERGHGVTSNHDFKDYSSDAYFWADDVEPLFAQAKAAGARVVEAPTTRFYGIREFMVKDYDGRVLTFGAPVEVESHGGA